MGKSRTAVFQSSGKKSAVKNQGDNADGADKATDHGGGDRRAPNAVGEACAREHQKQERKRQPRREGKFLFLGLCRLAFCRGVIERFPALFLAGGGEDRQKVVGTFGGTFGSGGGGGDAFGGGIRTFGGGDGSTFGGTFSGTESADGLGFLMQRRQAGEQVGGKRQLSARAVEILIRPVGLEIDIAREVVGEKTAAELKGEPYKLELVQDKGNVDPNSDEATEVGAGDLSSRASIAALSGIQARSCSVIAAPATGR